MALVKFGLVGLINTVIGLAIIMAALAAGLGDYAANALGYGAGLMLSYAINRRWTFAAQTAANPREFAAFAACFALAYGANLAVITAMRASGQGGHALVHASGMVVYTLLFFALSRTVLGGRAAKR